MSVGRRLRQAILFKHRNIKEFSDVSGISYNTLKKYIEENRSPHPDILIEIKIHLGIYIDWLLTGEGEMYISQISPQEEKAVWAEEAKEVLEKLTEEQRRKILEQGREMIRINEMEKSLEELKGKVSKRRLG